MNRDKPEEIDQQCNVCGSNIEVGSAWSRCRNSDCPTRETDAIQEKPYEGLPSLSTDATDEEIAEYWRQRALAAEDDGPSQDEIDEAVLNRYKSFKAADSHSAATHDNGAVKALLQFSTYQGWGALRMEFEDSGTTSSQNDSLCSTSRGADQ